MPYSTLPMIDKYKKHVYNNPEQYRVDIVSNNKVPLKDCNCLNCRLARIEIKLNEMTNLLGKFEKKNKERG